VCPHTKWTVLEVLDGAECRRLLGTVRVGRLGFTEGALPAIVPVPFALAVDSLVIPARQGNWAVGAMRASVVALGVDSHDVDERTGWGVTVVGPSRVVSSRRWEPPTTVVCTRLTRLPQGALHRRAAGPALRVAHELAGGQPAAGLTDVGPPAGLTQRTQPGVALLPLEVGA
jgi:hypothetical protein